MSFIIKRWASTAIQFKPEKPGEIIQLLKPIGLINRPLPNADENAPKTLQERKAELLDVKRNRIRREELKEEFAKSSFEDIYKFRHTGGKIFTAPPKPFSPEESLYMANIKGLRLDDSVNSESSVLHLLSSDKPNLVRLFSSALGKNQINEFTKDLDLEKMNVQLLDVNVPTNWVNRMLVKWFSKRIRKSDIQNPIYHKYLLADTKLSKSMKNSIAATNELAGYLYVVDRNGKIRWATSGPSIGNEKEKLLALLADLNAK